MEDPAASEPDKAQPDSTTLPDRRRPGRVAYRNPYLIALLRSSRRAHSPRDQVADDQDDDARTVDDLGVARGIAIACALGLLLWTAIVVLLVLWWRGTI
ncbi:MAG: hypothetical protein KGL52_05610 [Rhodospirillales bacterium]|nr:hypothetical protein [Rhodospirillales bacterium]